MDEEQRLLETLSPEARALSLEVDAAGAVEAVLISLEELIKPFQGPQPEGVQKVDYIGVNMGEGGIYPLIRL